MTTTQGAAHGILEHHLSTSRALLAQDETSITECRAKLREFQATRHQRIAYIAELETAIATVEVSP